MKYQKKPMIVDAIQITCDMFNRTEKFPDGVTIRQVPWEGQYARELELKHGPLDVPFVIEPTGPERLSVGDWVVTDEKGDRRRCEDLAFRILFEPVPLPKEPVMSEMYRRAHHGMNPVRGDKYDVPDIGVYEFDGSSWVLPREV